MAVKAGAIVYSILQFIAFLFVLVGTPIDQFRGKDVSTLGNTQCYTLWGYKAKCYSTKLTFKIGETFICSKRISRFKAGEAFAIISIIVLAVACVLGFIRLCCCNCFRWVCLILSIVGAVTSLIVWAIMAHCYSSNDGCPTSLHKDGYKYGAGFALYVTGWCLDIIAIIFLFIPC